MSEDKIKAGLQPPVNCQKLLKNVLYLPVNLSVPKKEMDIMIKRFLGICYRYQLMAEFLSKQQNKPIEAKAVPPTMGPAKL